MPGTTLTGLRILVMAHFAGMRLAVLFALPFVSELAAQVTTLEATSARSQNGGIWGASYFTGIDSGQEWRANFVFSLAGVTTPVSAARLELQSYSFTSSVTTEAITFFDSAVGAFSAADIASYSDLGGGTSYGTFSVGTGSGSTLVFTLNAAALQALNANLGGTFSIGAALNSIDGSLLSGREGLFFGSDASGSQSLVLTSAIPEPSTYAAILGAAGLGLAIWRRRTRKEPVAVN